MLDRDGHVEARAYRGFELLTHTAERVGYVVIRDGGETSADISLQLLVELSEAVASVS
jgi:hypothetical protein